MALSHPTTISYDEFADMRLEVGEPGTPYMVCSRAMARSSRAFRTMLFGGFSESKPAKGEWVVRLPADDAQAFEVLLNVIHGRSDRVSLDLIAIPYSYQHSATILYNIIRMADKYCILPLLRSWTNRWLQPWRHELGREAQCSGEVLHAAWIVGAEDVVSKELEKATFSMRYRGMPYKGRPWIMDTYGREHRLGALPDGPLAVIDWEGLTDVIATARNSYAERIADILKEAYYNTSGYERFDDPEPSEEDMLLFRSVLESTTTAMCRSKKMRWAFWLWDDDKPKAFKHTIPRLLGAVRAIGDMLLTSSDGTGNPPGYLFVNGSIMLEEGHAYFWALRNLVRLSDDHMAYLERRRTISGVELPWKKDGLNQV